MEKVPLLFIFLLFFNLAALGLSCSTQDLHCGMWVLVLCPGIEPGLPTLGAWSFSHWTTREVPLNLIKIIIFVFFVRKQLNNCVSFRQTGMVNALLKLVFM